MSNHRVRANYCPVAYCHIGKHNTAKADKHVIANPHPTNLRITHKFLRAAIMGNNRDSGGKRDIVANLDEPREIGINITALLHLKVVTNPETMLLEMPQVN